MRHSKKRHKLGVSGPHRLALLANLSVSLITHGRIKTTLAKAKALRPFVEKVITLAKKAESSNEAERKLHYRRLAISRINNPAAVALLFDNRVAEFMERPGGYTRIYKIGQRIGDAAEMALIELIDGNDEGYPKRPSRKTTEKSAIKDTDKTKEDLVADEIVAVTEEEATIEEPEADVADESNIKESKAEVDNEVIEDSAEESSDEDLDSNVEESKAEVAVEDSTEESSVEEEKKPVGEPSNKDTDAESELTDDTPEADEADPTVDEKKESN